MEEAVRRAGGRVLASRTMRRRDFLKGSLAAGAVAACRGGGSTGPTGPKPSPARLNQFSDPTLVELADLALDAAREAGATYADIRIAGYRRQMIDTREARVLAIRDSEDRGFGVRVIAKGTWGFAASASVTRDEVVRVARRAVEIAAANSVLQREPVQLAPVPAYVDVWKTPFRKDPFEVPLSEKVDTLLGINAEALKVKGVSFADSEMAFAREQKFFASTEGSYIEQTIHRCNPSFTVTSVDRKRGSFQTRDSYSDPRALGYEYIEEYPWLDDARQAGEDAVAKHTARSVEPGVRDLILHPTHLWLTIHESIGHPTELDRALGMEANFAGTSFLTTDKLGKFRVGSDIVNFTADKTAPGSLATCGYDDDGVKTASWPLVEGRHLRRLPDHARPGPPDRPEGLARQLLRPELGRRAVPAHAERQPRAGQEGAHRGAAHRRHRGRDPHPRARQLQHRPPALQLPVRRPGLLRDQEGEGDRHAARRRLPGAHARTSGARATRSATRAPTTWADRSTTARASPGSPTRSATAAPPPASGGSTSSTPCARSEEEAVLTRERAQQLVKQVLSHSKADEAEVVRVGRHGHPPALRPQHAVQPAARASGPSLTVRSSFGKKSGAVTVNQLDDDSLSQAVARAEEMARLAPEDPEYMPGLPQQQYAEVPAFFDSTASDAPRRMAEGVAACIQAARGKDFVAAGFSRASADYEARGNSRGLFGYHRSTAASFSATVRTPDGTGSGYAGQVARRIEDIDYAASAGIAVEKAAASQKPRELKPGKYVTILEPTCVANLLQGLGFGMDRRRADEGRSFFASRKRAGGTRLGEKLFGKEIDIRSDPQDERCPARPWGDDGVPQTARAWIDRGKVETLACDRFWATQQKTEPVPRPSNLVDGRRQGHAGRPHQVDQARRAGHQLLVHPLPRSRRRCSSPA